MTSSTACSGSSSGASTWGSTTSAPTRRSPIAQLAEEIGRCFGREVEVIPGALLAGQHGPPLPRHRQDAPPRLRAAGPPSPAGLAKTVEWYVEQPRPPGPARPGASVHARTPPRRSSPPEPDGSVVVERCQVCDSPDLDPVLFLGYLPPVNTMPPIGSQPAEQPAYPAQLLRCRQCELVQLGLVVDPAILFPPSYPYTSGTTKILRENFAELERRGPLAVSARPRRPGRRHRLERRHAAEQLHGAAIASTGSSRRTPASSRTSAASRR